MNVIVLFTTIFQSYSLFNIMVLLQHHSLSQRNNQPNKIYFEFFVPFYIVVFGSVISYGSFNATAIRQ